MLFHVLSLPKFALPKVWPPCITTYHFLEYCFLVQLFSFFATLIMKFHECIEEQEEVYLWNVSVQNNLGIGKLCGIQPWNQ